jgi:hypothetical protein
MSFIFYFSFLLLFSFYFLILFLFSFLILSLFFGSKNIFLHFKDTKLTLINYLLKFHVLITTKCLGHYRERESVCVCVSVQNAQKTL